jgi:hypothetical protein
MRYSDAMRALALASLLLAACSSSTTKPPAPLPDLAGGGGGGDDAGGGGDDGAVVAPTFTVGGTLSGLAAGATLVLDNRGERLTLTADGAFTFATALADSSAYAVTVTTQPAGQNCTVVNGAGAVTGANVTNVAVTCVTLTYTVGGTVSGLDVGRSLVLLDNGSDSLMVSANGTFTFATPLVGGAAYAVTVGTQPSGQRCTVMNGGGNVPGAPVMMVAVVCIDVYSVGGMLSGLGAGKSITLQNNGGDSLTLSGNGMFTFAARLAASAPYAVTISSQPAGQTCAVSAGGGTIGSAAVGNVVVSCINGYPLQVTVSGLVGGSAVLHNGGDDLTVTANQSYTFATYVLGYAVTVTNPTTPKQTCTIATGAIGTAAAPVSLNLNCVTLVVPQFPNNPEWNQYVKAGGTPDVACVPGVDLGYGACIHSGERRVLPLPDQSSCSGLTATDALGWSNWQCQTLQGTVSMVSIGLMSGKNLSDLVDFDAVAWRADSVTVLKDGAPLRTSASTVWWTNSVVDVGTLSYANGTDNFIFVTGGRTVYLVRSDMTRNLWVGTGAAVTIKPSATLTFDATRPIGINGDTFESQQDFSWLEGHVSYGGNFNAIQVFGHFSVVRNLTISGTGKGPHVACADCLVDTLSAGATVIFDKFSRSTAQNVTVQNGNPYGIQVISSTNSSFTSLNILNTTGVGLLLNATTSCTYSYVSVSGSLGGVKGTITSTGNTIDHLTDLESGVAGTANGVELAGDSNVVRHSRISGAPNYGILLSGKKNVVFDTTVGDGQSRGVYLSGDVNTLSGVSISSSGGSALQSTGQNNRVVQLTITGSGGEGIDIGASPVVLNSTIGNAGVDGFVGVNGGVLAASAVANFGNSGVRISGGATVYDVAAVSGDNFYFPSTTTFHGLLKLGGLVNGCTVDGSPGACPTTGGDLTVHTGVSIANSFVGKVLTDDATNPNDTSGQALFTLPIQYWASFDSVFRGWGKDGGTFPSSDQRGPCTTGTCRIWDWSAKLGDTGDGSAPVLLGVLGTPSQAITQVWTASDGPSCAALNVTQPVWDPALDGGTPTCTSKFLAHAIEIMGDGIGNENGLCEANETCLYTRNIGSYQGHGALVAGPAIGTIGSISGVTLMQYANNGY